MAQNKMHITSENVDGWLASTGFLFPSTILELHRFEKLYKERNINIEGFKIDPEAILKDIQNGNVVPITFSKKENEFRMAARKGDSNIPQEILDKIIKNQEKRKQDGSATEENDS